MKRMCLAVLLALGSLQGYGYDFAVRDINNNYIYYQKKSTTTVMVTYGAYSSARGYNYGYYGQKRYDIPPTVTYKNVTYTVTAIGDNAFRNSDETEFVSIPTTVESIGEGAFRDCTSLKGWSIPDGVTTIGEYAFYDCGRPVSPFSIPASVTKIGNYAFSASNFDNPIRTVRLEDSNESLSLIGVFSYRQVQEVYIGRNLRNCSEFFLLSSLKKVTMSDKVTEIEKLLFYGCTGLTSIHIPHSVTSIGEKAFGNCTNLTSVMVDAVTPPVATNDNVFSSTTYSNATLYVPAGTLAAYTAADMWKNFLKIASEMHLKDGETYDMGGSALLTDITYTRTFSNTNWQALYVPFSMEYADWSADFDVARINDVHQYDDDNDGTIDRSTLEFFFMPEGSHTTANTPYLIRAKNTGEKVLRPTNKTIYASLTPAYTVSSWNTLFTFIGTYTGVTGATMFGNGYYAMAGGGLKQPESSSVSLGTFRWYMAVTDRDGVPKDIGEVKIAIQGWDDEETGLQAIENGRRLISEGQCYYDLSGRRVLQPRRGLYVKDGKKVLFR